MSGNTDRKLQDVVVARYQYRHEAEFAAGFLDDAEIAYRLQVDDNSDFSSPEIDMVTTGTSHVAALVDGNYNWRVIVSDSSVLAGNSDMVCQEFWSGSPPTKPQM